MGDAGGSADGPRPGVSGVLMKRFLTVASFVVPVVLIVAGMVFSTRQVLAESEPRTASAAVRTQRDQSRGPKATDDVAMVGDSITETSEAALRDAIGSSYKLNIRARGGYRVQEMEPYAIELSTTQPEQVIINLGTNDVLQSWPLDESTTTLERMIKSFAGAKCIHIVTVNEKIDPARTAGVQERAAAFNVEIHRLADQYHLDVIDWAKTVNDDVAGGSKKGGLTVDSIHLNSLGKHQLGEMVVNALNACK
jgi:lysophospholipase L1-like esterase